MTDNQKAELRQLKTEATKREKARVFDNMNMPPRDITVDYLGRDYIRRAWQGVNTFGWDRWERA